MLVDVNTSCGRWPFQQFGPFTAEALQESLAAAGVTKAYVSSVEAVLAPDPSVEERRLYEKIAGHPFFSHAPLVSPMLHDWRDAIARACDQAGSKLIKIIPTYHRYLADGEEAAELVRAANESGLRVALVMRVEDERMHYPLMKVPAPTVERVAALAKAASPKPLLVLNAHLAEITQLAPRAENLVFDIAMAEGADPLRKLVEIAGAGRVLFGSHAPLMYAEAEARKLRFGALDEDAHAAIAHGNAERILGI